MAPRGRAEAERSGSREEVYARLGAMEQDLAGFQGEVRTQLRALDGSIREVAAGLRVLADKVHRPLNLGWLIGAGALIVSITVALVGGLSSQYITTLHDLKAEAVRAHASALDNAHGLGRLEAEREAHRERLTELSVAVRGLADEDYSRPEAEEDLAAVHAAIEALRAALHAHELRDGHPATVARLEGLRAEVEVLRGRTARAEERAEDGRAVLAKVDVVAREVDRLRAAVEDLRRSR